jgi:hypothetical protein
MSDGCEVCGADPRIDANVMLVRTTPRGCEPHWRCEAHLPRWRCFHCGEVFCNAEEAAEHFGTRQGADPACTIDVAKFREMEKRCALYAEEDTDLHRQIHRMSAEHQTALRREEEAGYARGLRDGRDGTIAA